MQVKFEILAPGAGAVAPEPKIPTSTFKCFVLLNLGGNRKFKVT